MTAIDSNPVTEQPPKRRTGRYVVAGMLAAVLVGGAITWHVMTSTFDMKGSLTLAGAQATQVGSACTGGWLRPGIKAGAEVLVYDASGKVVAKSMLMNGSITPAIDCSFPFIVKNVPTGDDFYIVEIAGAGKVTFTADEAATPALQLGK